MTRAGRSLLAAALICAPIVARADPADDILAGAADACTANGEGNLGTYGAVRHVDLTGDGVLDTIVDEGRFDCSSSPGLFCGSGGCTLHVLSGDRAWQYQSEGWRLIDWGDRWVLLIARDGGWCGGAGAQQCFEAVVWSAGEPLTVMPPDQ